MKSKRHEERKQRAKNRRVISEMSYAVRKGMDVEVVETMELRMVDECRHCRWGWK